MAELVKAVRAWFRHRLSWSNSRQAWQERLTFIGLLTTAAVLAWFGRGLALSRQVLLWTLWLLAVLALLRRGLLKLFGPVLFYDLVRTSRRGRYFLMRIAYASLLLLLLLYVYWVSSLTRPALLISEVAALAQGFFSTYLYTQFFIAALLTPAYTAGAVAEEKERKTLEFLLATDLRDREIVLSKLASRLLNLAFLLLAGLPILSFLQFLGGIDPDLVLAGFAFTGLTVFSVAALSVLNSVLLKKARDAIVLTYAAGVGYLALSGASWLLLVPEWSLADFPSTASWTSPVTVTDLVQGFNAGNIFSAMHRLTTGVSGRPFANIPQVLGDYAVFHGLAGAGSAAWAVLRLRPIALKEASRPQRRSAHRVTVWERPQVHNQPMVWKELYVEGGLRTGWLGRILILLLVLLSFVPVLFILHDYLSSPTFGMGDRWHRLGWTMNFWVRWVSTIMACLALLGVAVRAAGSISGERDRQTLDGLLLSPLLTDEILFGKWVGSILSPRWAWVYLGVVWFLAMLCGGLHPVAVPLLIAAWFIFAAFFCTLGLWFSTVSRTTLRATIYTIGTGTAISVGHFLIWSCCVPLAWASSGAFHGDTLMYLFSFEVFGLTPPATLAFLAFHGYEFDRNSRLTENAGLVCLICSIIGLVLWAIAAFALYEKTRERLRVVTGRAPFRPPARPRRPGEQGQGSASAPANEPSAARPPQE
jgi:ABC-type transport system involved in multi-copper enzyme maturation permease subunit